MIKMTIQDAEETAEFKVLEKPIIQKPLIAESDVVTIDNNLSTYVTGTQKRELTVGLGYLDSVGYETLRRIRDRQYAVLKYPTVTITADEPVDLGYGEDVPDYRERLVQLKGKNLFNKNDSGMLVEGYLGSQKFYTSSNYWTYYVPCLPNTTYTASRTISGGGRFAIAWADNDSTFPASNSNVNGFIQDNNASSLTITTGANAKYIAVWFYNANQAAGYTLDEWKTAQQLELGPEATSYEPYFNLELCKIGSYQDYIYKSGDNWVLHKEIGTYIMTGNETSTWDSSIPRVYITENALVALGINCVLPSSSGTLPYAVLNKFTAKTFTEVYTNKQGGFAMSTSGRNWNFSKLGWTSKDEAITDIAGAIIYYVLATPTNTEITNSTLITQLDALQNSAFDRWTQIETNVQELSLQPYLTVTQGDITGSGKEVMLEGTTEDLLDFVILGDTVQDGTPTPDSPVPVQTVNGDIAFDFSGPSGVKRYTMVGKMTLADQRIIDNCGTNEQVQVSFRESKQL